MQSAAKRAACNAWSTLSRNSPPFRRSLAEKRRSLERIALAPRQRDQAPLKLLQRERADGVALRMVGAADLAALSQRGKSARRDSRQQRGAVSFYLAQAHCCAACMIDDRTGFGRLETLLGVGVDERAVPCAHDVDDLRDVPGIIVRSGKNALWRDALDGVEAGDGRFVAVFLQIQRTGVEFCSARYAPLPWAAPWVIISVPLTSFRFLPRMPCQLDMVVISSMSSFYLNATRCARLLESTRGSMVSAGGDSSHNNVRRASVWRGSVATAGSNLTTRATSRRSGRPKTRHLRIDCARLRPQAGEGRLQRRLRDRLRRSSVRTCQRPLSRHDF